MSTCTCTCTCMYSTCSTFTCTLLCTYMWVWVDGWVRVWVGMWVWVGGWVGGWVGVHAHWCYYSYTHNMHVHAHLLASTLSPHLHGSLVDASSPRWTCVHVYIILVQRPCFLWPAMSLVARWQHEPSNVKTSRCKRRKGLETNFNKATMPLYGYICTPIALGRRLMA